MKINRFCTRLLTPVICVWMVCSGTGCTTMQLPEYRSAVPGANARTLEQRGLVFTVDPFFEKTRTEQYFGLDARQAGIVILHARITNRSQNTTFLLHKDNFKLLLDGARESETAAASNIHRRSAGGEAMAITGAALISLPLLFGGLKMTSNASVVQNNFTAKELGNQTLSPGQSLEGFIYYRVPEKYQLHRDRRFVATAKSITDRESNRFEFPLRDEN